MSVAFPQTADSNESCCAEVEMTPWGALTDTNRCYCEWTCFGPRTILLQIAEIVQCLS